MVGDMRTDNLAETLRRCGLVCSSSEAMRMAKSIVSTEQKVSRDFDNKRSTYEERIAKRQYANPQEEMNDLIERTSFEKKNYFIPISGYQRSRQPEQPKSAEQPVKAEEVQPVEIKRPDSIIPPEPEVIRPIAPLVAAPVPPAMPVLEEPVKAAPIAEIKPVYTDAAVDERVLSEVMKESSAEVYSNIKPVEKEVAEAPAEEAHSIAGAPASDSEFIIRDIPEEKPAKREFKNPVESVNLMSHFNFGKK